MIKRSNIYVLLVLAFVVQFGIVSAQSGPGGVGDSSSNVLWIRAEDLPLTDGQAVAQWNDISGNENHLYQANPVQQPIFKSNMINNKAAIQFDFNNTAGQNDYMWGGDSSDLDNTAGLSIFSVIRPTASGSARSIIAKRINVGVDQSYMLFFFTSNYLFADIVGNNNRFDTSPIAFAPNNNYLISLLYDGSLPMNLRSKIYSGQSLLTTSAESSTSIPNYNSPLVLGTTHIGDNRAFGGYMAEIIIFRQTLNSSQKMIVDNYLSSKYNIPLSQNDLYTMDNPANGDFDYEVAGIGRISNANKHIEAKGSGIVSILNPSNLGNDEFLFWGHNDLIEEAKDTIDVPVGMDSRFKRLWRVSEVNTSGTPIDVGAVDIRWDLSKFDSILASDLRMLIDTDNDGQFSDEAPIGGANLLSNNTYEFTNITGIQDQRRFTLGSINSTQTPLPVVWLYFDLKHLDNKTVLIEWYCASEINNDYFEVQRSVDLQHWTSIEKINARGNSNQLSKYSVIDNNVISGYSYYRIKQVDFNGLYEFSEVEAIFMEESSNSFNLYPNPSHTNIYLESKTDDLSNIEIYNSSGKNVSDQVSYKWVNKLKLAIHIAELACGQYYIKSRRNSIQFVKCQ